jgi:hypothetical protein
LQGCVSMYAYRIFFVFVGDGWISMKLSWICAVLACYSCVDVAIWPPTLFVT